MRWSLIVLLFALAGCGQPPVTPPPPAGEETFAPDAWLGRWPGVEGTYLDIAKGEEPGSYIITENTLDGVITFSGRAEGEAIAFERDGRALSIAPGDGAATGLKWLADKSDCLVIEPGEGFCR